MFTAKKEEKSTNVTADDLAKKKLHYQELQKEKEELNNFKSYIQATNAELQKTIQQLQNMMVQNEKILKEKESKHYEQIRKIDEVCKIYLSSNKKDYKYDQDKPIFKNTDYAVVRNTTAIPTSAMDSQQKQILDSLAELLVLLTRKFDIEVLPGSYHLLDNILEVVFFGRTYVRRKNLTREDYYEGPTEADLEGYAAFKYLESIGCKIKKDILGGATAILSPEQCLAAIKGLKLLADVTPQEIEERSKSRIHAHC